MQIGLSKEEMQKCMEFSRKSALNQQPIEFGQADTPHRSIKEISRDNLIGKIAEVAFAKMLKNKYNICVNLDFEYYSRCKWDKQDAILNGWRIDVKGTRQGGKWMLVEWNKLHFRKMTNELPHLFVMASVFWDRKNDVPAGIVDLIGSASIYKLRQNCPTTCIFKKGCCIPNTKEKLQADNFAISFDNLNQNWDCVIKYILNNQPPDLKNYPDPYQVQ